MADLIRTTAKLTYSPTSADGFQLKFGHSRDWRFDERWAGVGFEYIEPLHAIAPRGWAEPADMTLGDGWQLSGSYSQAVRNEIVSGSDAVKWCVYYDGSTYMAGVDDPSEYMAQIRNTGASVTNFALHMVCWTPPPGQGVVPQIVVRMNALARMTQVGDRYWLDDNGEQVEAKLSIIIPWGSSLYEAPMLHIQAMDEDGVWAEAAGQFLARLPMNLAADEGVIRTSLFVEFTHMMGLVPFPGSHCLIRSSQGDDWFHFYDRRITVTDLLDIQMGGAQCAVNISPIRYFGRLENKCYLTAPYCLAMPSARWNDGSYGSPTWSLVKTDAYNWTCSVTVEENELLPGVKLVKPTVVAECGTSAGTLTRPIIWLLSDIYPAYNQTVISADDDTSDKHILHRLEYTETIRWRNASGYAEFHAGEEMPLPNWHENGLVTISVGWQEGAGEGWEQADKCLAYIMQDGVKRSRSGAVEAGRSLLRLELGDFVSNRMQQQAIVDMKQAGGMNFLAWCNMVANRLCLPATKLWISPGLSGLTIPTYDPTPSDPFLWPQDGCSWEQHLDEVCAAVNCRWGWGPSGLFFDTGKEAYNPGVSTITVEIDEDNVTLETLAMDAQYESDLIGYRNAYKVAYGSEGNRQYAYYAMSEEQILADGFASWIFLDAQDAVLPGAAVAKYVRDYGTKHLLRWRMPYQPQLRPEKFVRVTKLQHLGITDGSVFQVIEHRFTVCNHPVENISEVVAELIYVPTGTEGMVGLGASPVGATPLGGATP